MSEIEGFSDNRHDGHGHARYPLANRSYPALRSEVQDIWLDDAIRRIWARRRLVALWVATLMVGGVIFVLGSRREYESRAVLLPEKLGESGAGAGLGLLKQFGGLLGGINPGDLMGDDHALTIDLYPDILQSTPVQLSLLQKDITIPSLDSTVSLRTYLEKHLPFSAWDGLGDMAGQALLTVFGNPERPSVAPDSGIIVLSPREREIVDELQDRLEARLDKKTGVLTISVEMPDPHVSALVASAAVQELGAYVTSYRVRKLSENLRFLEERRRESRDQFEAASNALARFRDRNHNLARDLARTEEQRLEAEFSVAYNVYNTLSSQVEEARIRLQEETPVFQVMEPVSVPLRKSSPRTLLILVISLLLGLVSATAYVLLLPDVQRFRAGLRQAEGARKSTTVGV